MACIPTWISLISPSQVGDGVLPLRTARCKGVQPSGRDLGTVTSCWSDCSHWSCSANRKNPLCPPHKSHTDLRLQNLGHWTKSQLDITAQWWLSDLRKNWVHYGSKSSRHRLPGIPKWSKMGYLTPTQTAKPRTFQQDCSLALHVVSDLNWKERHRTQKFWAFLGISRHVQHLTAPNQSNFAGIQVALLNTFDPYPYPRYCTW